MEKIIDMPPTDMSYDEAIAWLDKYANNEINFTASESLPSIWTLIEAYKLLGEKITSGVTLIASG